MKNKIFILIMLLFTIHAKTQSGWCESLCWQTASDCINGAQNSYAYCALGCSFDYLGDWINLGDWEARLNYEYCINYCYFDQLWTEFYCQRDYDSCIRACEG